MSCVGEISGLHFERLTTNLSQSGRSSPKKIIQKIQDYNCYVTLNCLFIIIHKLNDCGFDSHLMCVCLVYIILGHIVLYCIVLQQLVL